MKNKNKIIILSIFTVVLILLTFVMIVNDSLEYAIITIALTVMLFTYLCTLVFKKDDELSNYKKKLKNILKTYDSVLVYSGDELVLENENIIMVKKFDDILNVQEELKKPLLYLSSKKSSLFMIKDSNELIIYILKVNEKLITKYELQIMKYLKNKKDNKPSNKKILEDLEKTTFIQLKNNKIYKVSPIREEKRDN